MEYTRQYKRYPTQREAFYSLQDRITGKQGCTIFNVSRKGMGIVFHTTDPISIGEAIRLEIPVATALEWISVSGMVKWLDRVDSDVIGGIELNKELSDVKFSKLC